MNRPLHLLLADHQTAKELVACMIHHPEAKNKWKHHDITKGERFYMHTMRKINTKIIKGAWISIWI